MSGQRSGDWSLLALVMSDLSNSLLAARAWPRAQDSLSRDHAARCRRLDEQECAQACVVNEHCWFFTFTKDGM